MNEPNLHRRLVIDDDEAVALIWRSEDLLLQLAVNHEHTEPDAEPWRLPEPLAGRAALNALYRIWHALRPLLGSELQQPPTGRTLAPDGKYEHAPLRLVNLAQDDLDLLFTAATTCSQALTPGHNSESAEYTDLGQLLDVIELDRAHWPDRKTPTTAAGKIDPLARLAAILDLAPDTDLDLLTNRLATRDTSNSDIVLSPEEEAAYRRFATRWVTILSDGDPLQRWLY